MKFLQKIDKLTMATLKKKYLDLREFLNNVNEMPVRK